MVKVAVKPADGEYSASNEVKGYDAAGATASAPVEIPVAAAAAKVPVFLSKVRIEKVIQLPYHIFLEFIIIICLNAIHHDK